MSPIIEQQYRLRELGRVRMGRKGDKGQPQKLNTWRLTSASKDLLLAAAEKYGGEVVVWKDAPHDGEHFEIITESATLEVVIPPNDAAFSQWMEQWSGGGCAKRCDGRTQVLVDRPCSCPSDPQERRELAKDGKACKETTRFNVLLPDIPDIGVWRLETHGYYAAVELAGFQQLAAIATSRGQMIRARLRIDQRTAKKITNGKSQTHRYIVPVIEVSHTVGDVLQALGADVSDITLSLPAPVERKSLPGRAPLPERAEAWADDSGGDGDVAAQPQLPSPTGTTDEWVERMLGLYSEKDLILVADLVATQTGADFTIRTIDDVRERINPQSARVLIAQKLEEARQVSAGSVANGHGDEIPEGPSSAEPSASPEATTAEGSGARVGTDAAPLSEEGMEAESSSVSVPSSEDSSAVQESPTGAPPPVQQHADDGVAEVDQTADLPSPATGSASAASVEGAAAKAYAAAHPNELPLDEPAKSPADGDGTSTGPKPQSSSARSSKKGAK